MPHTIAASDGRTFRILLDCPKIRQMSCAAPNSLGQMIHATRIDKDGASDLSETESATQPFKIGGEQLF